MSETLILAVFLVSLAIFLYSKKSQLKTTFWYLRRRWHLFMVEEEPTRCLTLYAADLEGIKEIFKYIAERVGGRCEFDHILQYMDRNRYGKQLLSCRIIEGDYQHHFRVMPSSRNSFVITGHYEVTPESHLFKHYFGLGADLKKSCRLFKKFYEEYKKTSLEPRFRLVSHIRSDSQF